MNSTENVKTITEGQRFELAAMFVKAVPKLSDMPFETAKKYIGDQQGFVNLLRSTLIPSASDSSQISFSWLEVYHLLGLAAEYNTFPHLCSGESTEWYWEIPVLSGVTCNKVVQVLRELGVTVWTYTDDLDRAVTKNDRDPKNGSYIIHYRADVEADHEFKNMSANQLTERGITGMTLLERLLLELAYYHATKLHLDVESVTLCSGSRFSDGHVPDVGWYSGARKVQVGWSGPDYGDDSLRARAVRQ